MKSKITISLPALNKPQRDQIDALILSDREKTRLKLKEYHYKNDISHLRDKKADQIPQPPVQEPLPMNLNNIYKSVYPDSDLNLSPIIIKYLSKKTLSSATKTSNPDIFNIEKSPIPSTNAPTGRQEALNLKSWLELMEDRYLSRFTDLIKSKEGLDKEELLKVWKSIYMVGFREIERQVSVQCLERGQILEKITDGYVEIFDLFKANFDSEKERIIEGYEERIRDMARIYAEEISLMQGKIDSLEKAKETWRHSKGEIVVKVKELINYLEKLRKYEDKVKNSRGRVTYFTTYETFFNQIASNDENIPIGTNVSEKLRDDISSQLQVLAGVHSEFNIRKKKLKEIEIEINDAECVLSTLKFEHEIKEGVIKSKRRIETKSHTSVQSPVMRKPLTPSIRAIPEDEILYCEKFFRVLIDKSKDRLTHKAKISQDHIFKSITVILNRAVVLINAVTGHEYRNFRYLLYRQFVKSENRKKGEKILKNFLGGCLKFIEYKRVSVFLRLLGLGEWVSSSSFSIKSFLLYLSIFLFMQNSTVGLLLFKDSSSPIQYYPLSRSLSCLQDISPLFPKSSNLKLEVYSKNRAIPDPKQVNPLGIIELELLFEYILEEHERFIADVTKNCNEFFKLGIENKLSKELFMRLVGSLKEDYSETEADINKLIDLTVDEVSLDEGIEISCKFCTMTTEDMYRYLQELVKLKPAEAKALIRTKFILREDETIKLLIQNLDQIEIKHGLVWMKILE